MKYWLMMALMLFMGCSPQLDEEQAARLRAMVMDLDALPPSPTNRVADDPAAAALGRMLFFDTRLSMDGTIACASCHDPSQGWSDSRPLSLGVEDRQGGRHSMPIQATAFQTFWFWDGRADSLWSQAIKAIESHPEMDFSRMEVARFIARAYADEYTAIFGSIPSFDGLPERARPGLEVWGTIPIHQQTAVEEVFANTGKLLEAYERRLLCSDTDFDRWARGERVMSATEETGAVAFIQEGCIDCHSGPAFSDGLFHNIGLGSGKSVPDRGRADGIELLRADRFSGTGPYSDDVEFGALKLAVIEGEEAPLGAFRTPSLRGAAQRRSFGHRGHIESLEDFMEEIYDDTRLERSAVGRLDPLVRGSDLEEPDAVGAFLRMLDCPPVSPELGPFP